MHRRNRITVSRRRKFEIHTRAIRPVSLAPGWQAKQPFAAEIAFTSADSWNTLQPFPQSGRTTRIPKYTPTDLNDPKGPGDEERRGPFPVAVAVENKIPAWWVNEDYDREQAVAAMLMPYDSTLAVGLTVSADKLERPTRNATIVIGSGTLFTTSKLDPPEEKLLMHSVNWLTHREDCLPCSASREDARVALSARGDDRPRPCVVEVRHAGWHSGPRRRVWVVRHVGTKDEVAIKVVGTRRVPWFLKNGTRRVPTTLGKTP